MVPLPSNCVFPDPGGHGCYAMTSSGYSKIIMTGLCGGHHSLNWTRQSAVAKSLPTTKAGSFSCIASRIIPRWRDCFPPAAPRRPSGCEGPPPRTLASFVAVQTTSVNRQTKPTHWWDCPSLRPKRFAFGSAGLRSGQYHRTSEKQNRNPERHNWIHRPLPLLASETRYNHTAEGNCDAKYGSGKRSSGSTTAIKREIHFEFSSATFWITWNLARVRAT